MRFLASMAAFLAATAFAAAAQSPGKEVVVQRTAGEAGHITFVVFEQPKSGAVNTPSVEEATPAQGLPVYGATPELPNLRSSAWAQYHPSSRPSRQIEHVTGVVTAGYLR